MRWSSFLEGPHSTACFGFSLSLSTFLLEAMTIVNSQDQVLCRAAEDRQISPSAIQIGCGYNTVLM